MEQNLKRLTTVDSINHLCYNVEEHVMESCAGVMIMKNKLRNIFFLLALLLLPGIVLIEPVQAGDPDWTIGPPNPNHLVCVEENSHLVVDLPSDAIDFVGAIDPDAEVNIERLERECQEVEDRYRDRGFDYRFKLEYLRQTRLEGYVFEFHPDPNGPGGWTGVRSRDVPVVASGPGFEIFWGSEKDGFYYFDNLGAGPVALNLRLPPDAHPINPNIIVMTDGLPRVWEVDLAFYRGNYPPPNIDEIILPHDHPRRKLIAPDTIAEIDEETGDIVYLPNVGGVLPLDQPVAIIIMATLVLIILPTAGILTVRHKRTEN